MARLNTIQPSKLNKTERKQQTQMIMRLFSLWNLTDKEKAIALGLSTGTQTSIHKYKTGKQDLPLMRDIQDRVGHLLAIHKYLKRAYPFDKELAYQWIKTSNSDFNNLPPFNLIFNEGYLGLVKVRNYLEISEHQQDNNRHKVAAPLIPLKDLFDHIKKSESLNDLEQDIQPASDISHPHVSKHIKKLPPKKNIHN